MSGVLPATAFPSIPHSLTVALRDCRGPGGDRPCPDRAVIAGPRCHACRLVFDRERRPPPSQRGHGHEYRISRETVIGAACELRLRGCTGVATTADYRIPVSRGGTLEDGLLGACAWCNTSRGNRLLSELEARR